MPPLDIVEHRDVIEESNARCGPVRKALMGKEFASERSEETLRHRVVEAITPSPC